MRQRVNTGSAWKNTYGYFTACGIFQRTLTPHVGGMTDEAFERMLKNAIANFERCVQGEHPVNVVNQ